MNIKRWMILLLSLGIVVLFVWASRTSPTAVQAITPKVQSIRAYVQEQAVTELPQDYLISMPINGWLNPIALREGDTVKTGDVVATLETSDLKDKLVQAQQRMAMLQVQIAEAKDHRLEENAKVEMQATVKAINETVEAATARLDATHAVLDYAKEQVERLRQLTANDASTDRERRLVQLELRKANSDYQGDAMELAALRTIAAVSYIGPKFVNDYIDRKTFTLERLQKELIEATTQRDIEQRNLDRARIASPVNGTILSRHQTRHQYLTAGTPLLTIGKLDDMEVIAEVLTERAVHIQPGDPVEIFDQTTEGNYITGKVSRVYPSGFKKISSLGVEQQRVNVAIHFDKRPENLGVGFRVQVRIVYDHVDDAITLPRTCLFRADSGQWQVMAIENDTLKLRDVQVGLMNDDIVQILEGIAKDQPILAYPSRDLEAGMAVKPALN